MPKKAALIVLALTLVGIVGGPAIADQPVADSLQQEIDDALARYPGGVQVSPTTVSWEDGAVLLTFPSATDRAIGTCATGSYCVFSGTRYGGTRLAFTGCSATTTSNSVSSLNSAVRSVANARTSGTVRVMDGITVVHALTANAGLASNTAAVTALSCTT